MSLLKRCSMLLQLAVVVLLASLSQASSVPSVKDKLLYRYEASPLHRSGRVEVPYQAMYAWDNSNEYVEYNHNCYTLTKSTTDPKSTIEVSFKFANSTNDPKFRPLFQFRGEASSKNFCLDQYVYLNRMASFELQFVVLGEVATPFEVKLIQRAHSDDNSVVQTPYNATIFGGWFFMNSVFDYSFVIPYQRHVPQFKVCDVIANCYPLKVSIDTQRMKYSLTEKYRNILKLTTPFIRIHIDEVVDASKVKLEYNNAPAKSLQALQSRFPGSTIVNNQVVFHKQVLPTPDPILVSIPLDIIDLRIQQVVTFASIINGNLSQFTFTSVKKSGNGGEGFNWPDANVTGIDQFNVSTYNFVTPAAGDIEGSVMTGQSLEFGFKVHFDPNISQTTPLDVKFVLEIKPSHLVLGINPNTFMLWPLTLFDFPTQRVLYFVDWSYSENRSNKSSPIYQNRIKVTANSSNKTITPENVRVSRVILGSHGKFFKVTPLTLTFDTANQQANDTVLAQDLPPTEDFFQMGYLIDRHDVLADFLVVREVHRVPFDAENCKHSPTFSPMPCDRLQFRCSPLMTFDSKAGACTFASTPQPIP